MRESIFGWQTGMFVSTMRGNEVSWPMIHEEEYRTIQMFGRLLEQREKQEFFGKLQIDQGGGKHQKVFFFQKLCINFY